MKIIIISLISLTTVIIAIVYTFKVLAIPFFVITMTTTILTITTSLISKIFLTLICSNCNSNTSTNVYSKINNELVFY